MARCDVENLSVVSRTSYCFVDHKLEISSVIRACFGIVHKSSCRSTNRRSSLNIEESDRTGVPMNGGTTTDACVWKLVLAFLFPLVKWPTCMGFREVLVVLLCCLLTTDVANASIKCPQPCICSDSPVMNAGGQLSINCSSLNLLRYNLHYSNILEQNTTYNNSSNPYNNNRTIEAVQEELYSLYLSHNSLTSVKPDLIFVDPPSTNESFLIKVQIFNISHNNILTVSREDLSVFHEIKTLDASYNKIQKLDGDVFTGLSSLICINLSHNAIEDIDNETFLNLDELQILDLSYNNIHVFAIGNLPALSSLQYLYLNGNNIQSIYSSFINIPPSLPQLSFLDLSSNQIIDIPANQFQCCPGLRTLNMANNSIEGFNKYFLKGLYSLQELALDYNEISSISQPVFQNTSLIKLSLSNMPNLRNISHNAFLGLSKLLYLNLSHNSELSFLQPNLLTPLIRLQTLDVSSCSLTQLSSITFHKNEDLREVHLQNNPLSCSCVNAWLAAEASNDFSKFLDAGSLSCLSNSGLHHHFKNASSDCQEIFIHNTSSTTNSKLGSQILFTCQHQTQNPEIVTWTTPRGKIFYQHHFHPEASQHLLSPEDIRPDSDFHNGHYWHHTSTYHSDLSSYEDRVMVLTDGSLYIDYMLRSDAGLYRCQISNSEYNQTITINLYVDCTVSSSVKIFGCIVGLLCAVSFFTLNLIYVIISWTARRLVNKRRREIIRQMLESLNAYKSLQIARIHENYTHQLSRVRNQYHVQCNRLHRNYSVQVTRMKRGCSNQVERVRDNYHSKLTHLREYSSSQIMQIRERANCQIIRIRDYGSTQLEKLRETYKLQHQHVMKLLDTMNLENCRNVVETECMRAESMMYDIDLLGDDDRTDSPTSAGESEYSTAASSPSSSLEDDHHGTGLRRDMTHDNRELSTGSSDNSGAIREVQTTIDLEIGLQTHIPDAWKCCDDRHEHPHKSRKYLKSGPDEDQRFLQLQGSQTHLQGSNDLADIKQETPLPVLHLHRDKFGSGIPTSQIARAHRRSDSDAIYDGVYMTPEASPTKLCSQLSSVPTFQHMDRDSRPRKHKRTCDKNDKDSGSREESAV